MATIYDISTYMINSYKYRWALIAPNRRAIDGEDGKRPYLYRDLEEVRQDVLRFNETDYSS